VSVSARRHARRAIHDRPIATCSAATCCASRVTCTRVHVRPLRRCAQRVVTPRGHRGIAVRKPAGSPSAGTRGDLRGPGDPPRRGIQVAGPAFVGVRDPETPVGPIVGGGVGVAGETSRSPLVRTSDGRCAGTNSSHKRGPSLGGPRAAHLIHSPIGLNVDFSHRKALRNRGRADAGVRTGEVGHQVRGHPTRARKERGGRGIRNFFALSSDPPSTALSAGPTPSLFPFRFRSIPLGGSLSLLSSPLARARSFVRLLRTRTRTRFSGLIGPANQIRSVSLFLFAPSFIARLGLRRPATYRFSVASGQPVEGPFRRFRITLTPCFGVPRATP